jgi:hypothetical protein
MATLENLHIDHLQGQRVAGLRFPGGGRDARRPCDVAVDLDVRSVRLGAIGAVRARKASVAV